MNIIKLGKWTFANIIIRDMPARFCIYAAANTGFAALRGMLIETGTRWHCSNAALRKWKSLPFPVLLRHGSSAGNEAREKYTIFRK